MVMAVLDNIEWDSFVRDHGQNITIDRGLSDPILTIFFCLPYIIIILIGLCANCWTLRVCVTVLKCGARNVNALTYISVLAVVDILVCVMLLFTIVDITSQEWLFGSFLCSAYWLMEIINKMGSTLILTCLTVACYCAVCQPQMIRMHQCATVACLHVVAVFGFVAWRSKPFVEHANVHYVVQSFFENGTWTAVYSRKCHFVPPNNTDLYYYTLDICICGFVLPMFYMILFYAAILRTIIIRSKLAGRCSPPRHFWKAARSASFLMAFHFITWTPYWVVTIRMVSKEMDGEGLEEDEEMVDDNSISHLVPIIVHIFPFVNVALSLFLYTFSNGHIRVLYNASTGNRQQRRIIRRKLRLRQHAGTSQQARVSDGTMQESSL